MAGPKSRSNPSGGLGGRSESLTPRHGRGYEIAYRTRLRLACPPCLMRDGPRRTSSGARQSCGWLAVTTFPTKGFKGAPSARHCNGAGRRQWDLRAGGDPRAHQHERRKSLNSAPGPSWARGPPVGGRLRRSLHQVCLRSRRPAARPLARHPAPPPPPPRGPRGTSAARPDRPSSTRPASCRRDSSQSRALAALASLPRWRFAPPWSVTSPGKIIGAYQEDGDRVRPGRRFTHGWTARCARGSISRAPCDDGNSGPFSYRALQE
jgi:hypothetical protein